jgi:hypothetical protein
MRNRLSAGLAILSLLLAARFGSAQSPAQPAAPVQSPPATKLEAFKPAAGTILTIGFNELGHVGGVEVDTRELRDGRGGVVRGVVVDVTESQYREERSFVDSDELPELIKGMDALLAVNSNPTSFQNFEVRYRTRGELEITAFSHRGSVEYAVQAGRGLHSQVFTDAAGIRQLKAMFETAVQQLASVPAK